MIESGGRGGFFNHSVEVAAGLQSLGIDVVLHTAADHEEAPASLHICKCIKWHRRFTNRRIRQATTTASYIARTLPHLRRAISSSDIVHIQGLFALTPELISVARARKATVVCSPHNTFTRTGAVGAGRALQSVLLGADRILVYSEADVARLADAKPPVAKPPVAKVPLLQWTPPADPHLVERWRDRLRPDGLKLALMPGQVRMDKNPDQFIRAMAAMPGWCGAIVGDDLGPGSTLDDLVRQLGAPVTTAYSYVDVDSFTALIAAADVVVAPYEVASQSGVLAVAQKLGIPTAVSPVGGLRELGTVVARDNTPESIREAIVAAVGQAAAPPSNLDATKIFIDEYEAAVRSRRAALPQLNSSRGTHI